MLCPTSRITQAGNSQIFDMALQKVYMIVLVDPQKLLGVNLTNSQHLMYLFLNSLLKFGLNIRNILN
jgi:ABC-type tungstate transport system permease subunit